MANILDNIRQFIQKRFPIFSENNFIIISDGAHVWKNYEINFKESRGNIDIIFITNLVTMHNQKEFRLNHFFDLFNALNKYFGVNDTIACRSKLGQNLLALILVQIIQILNGQVETPSGNNTGRDH
ncbi:hypothetical protein BpHYR1_050295 [Brachionus plicatilis]|uniref:Uncharacterized protein n=1 Tax=Brachionus plicatilis TaxID=10195 RepID=A0A3M7R3N3_BRAPC|nr:hypothetical protein BpHYR1_050295 [Brachionus plicatilis]